MAKNKTNLINSKGLSSIIKRISHEIIESSPDKQALVLIGIKSRGDYIAKRISEQMSEIIDTDIPIGTMDVTFHRDDYRTNLGSPKIGISDIKFDINDKNIILIDDVLYTGRTIRAAMEEIFSYGRPKSIKLVVIVDRGHRELPIKADYVGKNFPTADNEHIYVLIEEVDDQDLIYIEKEVNA
tara:strand:- start:349 stop:897 length:549 start_codon:yes stop_codon:yes gene_type:complete